MKKQLSLTLAATMAFTGCSIAATVNSSGAPHAITSAINPGIQVKDSLDAANIHKAIVDLVADALTPKDMDQLVHRFTNSDQKRIENSSTYKQNDGKLLDDCVGRINNDWKKAYGHDFSIKETSVFKPDFYSIEQSTAGADKELAQDVTANSSMVHHALAHDQKIAMVTLKATHNMAELKVPLIYESGNWRINVPNNEDASALRQNLVDHLSAVSDASAHWPKDEDVAYRMVTRHVLLAALNQPVTHSGHAGK
ncbi:MAG TPA: hypothetical protein VHX86_17430 [Tepidisphaeraceae bacterium]|jgi:hypothetical protein|nr:hypothetical protein [Tepidisphaeraceae bacterium]